MNAEIEIQRLVDLGFVGPNGESAAHVRTRYGSTPENCALVAYTAAHLVSERDERELSTNERDLLMESVSMDDPDVAQTIAEEVHRLPGMWGATMRALLPQWMESGRA